MEKVSFMNLKEIRLLRKLLLYFMIVCIYEINLSISLIFNYINKNNLWSDWGQKYKYSTEMYISILSFDFNKLEREYKSKEKIRGPLLPFIHQTFWPKSKLLFFYRILGHKTFREFIT